MNPIATTYDLGAPSLPSWLFYPTSVLLIVPLLYALLRTRSWIARYSIFVPWFRYMMGAFHTISFQQIAMGLSINAIASSLTFVVGLLMVRPRNLMLKMVFPFYIIMGVVIISGLANLQVSGTINVIVKYGYLLVITIGIYEALGTTGERKFMVLLLWSFAPVIVFQVLSVIFGVSKATEADGSTSYIGGYNHEAAFSIVLDTCFTVACLATGLKRSTRTIILAVCLGGILLANYRTSIIAIVPLAIVQFNADVITRFSPRQRSIVAVAVITLSLMAFAAVAWILRDRLADLITALEDYQRLMKPPIFYTDYEKTIMSARPYIWAGYIYGYADGNTINHIFGFGPESWQGLFKVYAHNTLVSTLYEYGLVGIVAMIFLWATFLLAAMRVKHGPKAKLIGAHLSFLLLNMATMPHWMIEGDIWYAIICGCTLHYMLRPAEQKAPVAAPAPKRRGPMRPAVTANPRTLA